MTTWILVANAADAKLFMTENLRIGRLQLSREFLHPESRKKVTDIVSDRPGHYKTDGGVRGSYGKIDPKEVEAERFAIQLAHELKNGWNKNQYKHLVIVAPAHFYGVLKKHLDSHIADMVYIPKDYTKYTLADLTASLKEHLFNK